MESPDDGNVGHTWNNGDLHQKAPKKIIFSLE